MACLNHDVLSHKHHTGRAGSIKASCVRTPLSLYEGTSTWIEPWMMALFGLSKWLNSMRSCVRWRGREEAAVGSPRGSNERCGVLVSTSSLHPHRIMPCLTTNHCLPVRVGLHVEVHDHSRRMVRRSHRRSRNR